MYERFAKLLDERHIKAADICRSTGLPSSLFSEWKRGKSTPKMDKLQKIADYFGVSLEYLMGWEKTVVPIEATEGLDPEYINLMIKARDEGFTPKDIEVALNMLRMARG